MKAFADVWASINDATVAPSTRLHQYDLFYIYRSNSQVIGSFSVARSKFAVKVLNWTY